MKYQPKNILISCLLGAILLVNTVNFHVFTHFFDSDESDPIECEYCILVAQQEEPFYLAHPSSPVIVYNTPDHKGKINIDIPRVVKKTIITDYFFNKPPPVPFIPGIL